MPPEQMRALTVLVEQHGGTASSAEIMAQQIMDATQAAIAAAMPTGEQLLEFSRKEVDALINTLQVSHQVPGYDNLKICPGLPALSRRIGGSVVYDEDMTVASVRDLEALDDEYLAVERELEAKQRELDLRHRAQLLEHLQRRAQFLRTPHPSQPHPGAMIVGTPAAPGFWKKVLKMSYEFEQDLEKWDEMPLMYLEDISWDYLKPEDAECKDFRIRFKFVTNTYFSNSELDKTYYFSRKNPYSDTRCVRIEASEIAWRPGKNVTVELVAKEPKRGRRRGAKKKCEEVPRPSFFRRFFRNLGPDAEIPEEELLEDEDEEDPDLMLYLIRDDLEQALALRDHLIPRAIRWYTGEAIESDDEEAESEDEDAEDEVVSSSDSEVEEPDAGSSQDVAPPRKKAGKGSNKIPKK